MQMDNGSEFAGTFAAAADALGIARYFSRVRTTKDNDVEERFNRALSEEFFQDGNLVADVALFNRKLAPWILE